MQNIQEISLETPSENTPPRRTFDGERTERYTLLVACAAIVILSSILGINSVGQVYLPPFETHGGPTFCVTKLLFHRDCAGCGITRSLIGIGHGDWRASLAYHPAGIAFYVFLWAQIVFQTGALRRMKNGHAGGRSRFLSVYFYLLVAAFLATGVYRFWPR